MGIADRSVKSSHFRQYGYRQIFHLAEDVKSTDFFPEKDPSPGSG
jgi:hypothetical protein